MRRPLWALVAASVAVATGAPAAPAEPEPVGAVNVGTGPIGGLDRVRAVPGGVEVTGWALRTDGGRARPRVEVTASGELLARTHPSASRPDLQAAFGVTGRALAFTAVVRPPTGSHTVCMDARATRAGAPVRLGCAPFDVTAASRAQRRLTRLLRGLGREAERRLPGVTVAMAVIPFDTGVTSTWRGNRLFISASAPKAWWTAAALAAGREEEAAAWAPSVFRHSSDAAAGAMIDLAGGIDAVNDFTLSMGMEDTAVMRWNAGRSRPRSLLYPGPLGGSNHVDATDAAAFYYAFGTRQVLDPELTDRLARWLRWSPRHGGIGDREASTIPHALPAEVRDLVEQKGGWLRPWEYSVPGHLLGAGIVHPTNGGPSYAVALMAAGGSHAAFVRMIELFRSVSCQIYVHVSGHDSWRCPDW